jgi:hypothetical protein
MKLESFDNTKKKCIQCKSYFTPAPSLFLFCSNVCYDKYRITESKKNIAAKYRLEPGELQWLWRNGKRKDKSELSDAVIDALAQGGIYSWNGDGVGCVVQIIEAFAKQQNEN